MRGIEIVHKTLAEMGIAWEDETLLVAVSGGLDSLVMLDILHQLQASLGYTLHVATFNHGLRGMVGADDAAFVGRVAEGYGLALSAGEADVAELAAQFGGNLEASARQARYSFLLESALDLDATYIALGHHQDDQIETILMHILRGTGPSGLRGMLPLGNLSESHLRPDASDELLDAADYVKLLRPLLNLSQSEVADYAAQRGILAREDSTNADVAFLRNRLRHEVIPLLTEINPNLRQTLSRMASVIQGDYDIIQQVVRQNIAQLVEWNDTLSADGSEDGTVAIIDRHEFLRLSLGLQRQIIRHILFDLTPAEVPYIQIQRACEFIGRGKVGQQLSLPDTITLSLGYDEFMIYDGGELPFPPQIPHLKNHQVIPLELENEHIINGRLRVYSYWVNEAHSQDLSRSDPLEATLCIAPSAELSLRTRRVGDRFAPMGMDGHRQKLADIFSNLKVPKAFRDRVPLLTVNEEIAWFIAPTLHGIQGRVADQFAVKNDSESVLRIRWEVLPE